MDHLHVWHERKICFKSEIGIDTFSSRDTPIFLQHGDHYLFITFKDTFTPKTRSFVIQIFDGYLFAIFKTHT